MSDEKKKEKRCVFCGKKLLDEKIPICLRCGLIGRNKAEKAISFLSIGGITLISIIRHSNNSNNDES